MPYFPPHVWGVENVWQEIWEYWTTYKYWLCTHVIFDVWGHKKEDYKKASRGTAIVFLPAFDLITNFPVPKIWKKDFWKALHSLEIDENTRVLTHTRFFLSSLVWWIFAKRKRIKWTHVEHGSDYVTSNSKGVSFLAKAYDSILGKWVCKSADNILTISQASRSFIQENFVNRDIEVFYRGVNIINNRDVSKKSQKCFVYIWRIVHLKWVRDLIDAYIAWNFSETLYIIWDWEERRLLEKLSQWYNIEFLWFKDRMFVANFLHQNKCIVINPSKQEWLPTTVIEWLLTKNIVIATDVWWTKEISIQKDLFLYKSGDLLTLEKYMRDAFNKYEEYWWESYSSVKEKFSWEENLKVLYWTF